MTNHPPLIYRGYEIRESKDHLVLVWEWTDERNFNHGPFASIEEAQTSIDNYKRNMASGRGRIEGT